ncbi:MAG: NPCBM/NEW2 domain-containing protein [Sarcina sp.]
MIDSTINSYEIPTLKNIDSTFPIVKHTYNEVAQTPPMGWCSAPLGNNINESTMTEVTSALSKCGLINLGYKYFNLDDGWQAPTRNSNGKLQFNGSKFPNGISALNNQLSSKGMKLGLYSSNGATTCLGSPGSLNNETIDAETFASWGVEYLKYDFCNNVQLPSTAPDIDKIAISLSNSNTYIYSSLEAENAKLLKNASIVQNSSSSNGKHVTGLSGNNGYILFSNISMDNDGYYDLWVYFKSTGYVEVCVNYGDIYPLNILSTITNPIKIPVYLRKGLNSIMLYNDIVLPKDSASKLFSKMGKALKNATKINSNNIASKEKQIVFSISDLGANSPWEWAKFCSNCWSTAPSLTAEWNKIMYTYSTNMKYALYATPGCFNDAHMLQVGNGSLTFEENKSHFTLWCMMCSPLIIGTDVRKFINSDGSVNTSNEALKILSNKDMISINQDKKGLQCRFYENNSDIDILFKPLTNNELAVCILNKTSSSQNVGVSILDILNKDYVTLPLLNTYRILDLWDKTSSTTNDLINVSVPSHGVKAFKITKPQVGQLSTNQSFSLNIPSSIAPNTPLTITATLTNTGLQPIKNINIELNAPKDFLANPILTRGVALQSGESYSAAWSITSPSLEWDYILNATATFNYDGETTSQSITTSSHTKVLNLPMNRNFLSNINWLNSSSILGAIERNKVFTNKPMSINGVSYSSGISFTANSEIQLFNCKNPVTLYALIGIDDSVVITDPKSGFPTPVFQVFGDNQKIYDSGILKYGETKEIFLDLSFYEVITLKVLDFSNIYNFAHYNWVNVHFSTNSPC